VTFVITRLCRDCLNLGCVHVCPTACIVEHRPRAGGRELPNQLFIDPDECIDCGACVPECPWEAIYADADVPASLLPDIALNALVLERRAEFVQPELRARRRPDADEVRSNRARWGCEK
jgi:ferredoxin